MMLVTLLDDFADEPRTIFQLLRGNPDKEVLADLRSLAASWSAWAYASIRVAARTDRHDPSPHPLQRQGPHLLRTARSASQSFASTIPRASTRSSTLRGSL